MALHLDYCASFGLSKADIERSKESQGKPCLTDWKPIVLIFLFLFLFFFLANTYVSLHILQQIYP